MPMRLPDKAQPRRDDGTYRVPVLIADPHPGTRSAIRGALQEANTVEVVGDAPDLPSAISAASAHQVDVILADSRLAGLGSESARAGLAELSRRAPVIVMGMGDPGAYTAPLQAAGAAGYWPKDGDLTQLTALLEAAAQRPPASWELTAAASPQ